MPLRPALVCGWKKSCRDRTYGWSLYWISRITNPVGMSGRGQGIWSCVGIEIPQSIIHQSLTRLILPDIHLFWGILCGKVFISHRCSQSLYFQIAETRGQNERFLSHPLQLNSEVTEISCLLFRNTADICKTVKFFSCGNRGSNLTN